MSVILRPNCPAQDLMHLTCAAAVAMCDAVEAACGIRPGIKWTNDLVIGTHKIGGILTELGLSRAGTAEYAIIGVGINCCQRAEDFPEEIRHIAASLHSITGKEICRAGIAACMIDSFLHMDAALLTGKAGIMDRYRADCITLGRQISVLKADGSVRHGTAEDIDADGGLLVRFDNGTVETVSSGEVSIRGMYGYV